MTHDPFAALEDAVAAVELALGESSRRNEAAAAKLARESAQADGDGTDRGEAIDAADRIAALEAERAAIRERLQRVRGRLLAATQSSKETLAP